MSCLNITILVKTCIRLSTFNASRKGSISTYLVSLLFITIMLLYLIPMRGSFNLGSLVMKSRAILNYSLLGIASD
jgi:hypothetical protein